MQTLLVLNYTEPGICCTMIKYMHTELRYVHLKTENSDNIFDTDFSIISLVMPPAFHLSSSEQLGGLQKMIRSQLHESGD